MLVPIPLVMRGVPAQIFFAVPGDGNVKLTSWGEKQVELTLDHPLQVKLELDLLAGVDDVDELEEGKEAQSCQRPKRPHQNFHFQQCPNISPCPKGLIKTRLKLHSQQGENIRT